MTWLFASYERNQSTTQNIPTSVRKPESDAQNIPTSASVLLGVLKVIEIELRNRELLGAAAAYATPLWFIAETERNVFLWRNWKSLDHRTEFSFWINLEALLKKRRAQLLSCSGFNPFINFSPNSGGAEFELRYLDELEELLDTVFTHASALCRTSTATCIEVVSDSPPRTVVILPEPIYPNSVNRGVESLNK